MKLINKIFFGILILLFPAYFILLSLDVKPILGYTVILLASSAVFIAIFIFLIKNDIDKKYFLALLAAGIIIRVIFLFVQPVGSDDYYRYVWDGKVQASGINPYRYAPDDPALNALHTQALPSKINFSDMKTIYPPLAEMIFFAAYAIGGTGFFGIKLILLASDLLTITGLYLILKKTGSEYKYLLIYVLCPLIIFQFFIDGHLDGYGLPFLIFALYFFLGGKKTAAYVLIGLSICIKPLALIFIPLFFFHEKNPAEKFKTVIIPAVICFLLYLPYVFTGSPFQALMKFTENWTFNGVVFDILDSFIRDNQKTRLICGILLVIFYLPVILSKKDLLEKIYLSVFLLFIFSPIVHPWYLSWLAVLLPFIPRRSGIVYIGLAGLTVFTVLHYQLTGTWNDYTLVLIFEYAPVIFLFIKELIKGTEIPGRQIN